MKVKETLLRVPGRIHVNSLLTQHTSFFRTATLVCCTQLRYMELWDQHIVVTPVRPLVERIQNLPILLLLLSYNNIISFPYYVCFVTCVVEHVSSLSYV